MKHPAHHKDLQVLMKSHGNLMSATKDHMKMADAFIKKHGKKTEVKKFRTHKSFTAR